MWQGGIRYSHIAPRLMTRPTSRSRRAPDFPNCRQRDAVERIPIWGRALSTDQDHADARSPRVIARRSQRTSSGGSSAPAIYQSDSLISLTNSAFKGALASHRWILRSTPFESTGRISRCREVESRHRPSNFTTTAGRRTVQGMNSSGLPPRERTAPRVQRSARRMPSRRRHSGLGSPRSRARVPYAPKVSYAGTVRLRAPLSSTVRGSRVSPLAGVGSRRAVFHGSDSGASGVGPGGVKPVTYLPMRTLDLRGGINLEQRYPLCRIPSQCDRQACSGRTLRGP